MRMLVFLAQLVLALALSKITVHMTIDVAPSALRKIRHLSIDGKEFDVFLEECFDGPARHDFPMKINGHNHDASGSIDINDDMKNPREMCTLNVKISKKFARLHPAVIALCDGGECVGGGTCNSECANAKCDPMPNNDPHGHIKGQCFDKTSADTQCKNTSGCTQCSSGILHIECHWDEYDSKCTTSCGSNMFTYLIYYVLFPCIAILCLVALWFMIRYCRKKRTAGWRLRHSSSFSSFSSAVSSVLPWKKRNLKKPKKPMEQKVDLRQSPASPSQTPQAYFPSQLADKLPSSSSEISKRGIDGGNIAVGGTAATEAPRKGCPSPVAKSSREIDYPPKSPRGAQGRLSEEHSPAPKSPPNKSRGFAGNQSRMPASPRYGRKVKEGTPSLKTAKATKNRTDNARSGTPNASTLTIWQEPRPDAVYE